MHSDKHLGLNRRRLQNQFGFLAQKNNMVTKKHLENNAPLLKAKCAILMSKRRIPVWLRPLPVDMFLSSIY